MYDFQKVYGMVLIVYLTILSIYLQKENDIIALNMKTGNIEAITTDHRSVNPYLSPHGRYLLINKQDEYWTIYDTVNKTKKIVLIYVGMLYQMNIHFMVMIILLLMVMIIRS